MKIKSDKTEAKLHALFPTMVYQANLERRAEFQDSFANAIEEFGFSPQTINDKKHHAGEYHGKILLHQEPSLRPFFECLAVHVGRYLRELA